MGSDGIRRAIDRLEAEREAEARESDDDVLERLIREVVREELRRVGLRPPMPSAYGVWRWDAEADAWERSDG